MIDRPSLFSFRPVRFIRTLWTCRKLGLSRHNVRALWRQSESGWTAEGGLLSDLTDEEFDAFMAAVND